VIRHLELRDTPPSINAVGSRGHWRTWHGLKTRWQRNIEALLMAEGLPRPLPGAVRATAELRFPTARRRDEGNYRPLLALGDALVNGRWIADDTPDLYSFGVVTFDATAGAARTILRLSSIELGARR
jgi:hypothetical protein